MSYRIDRSLVLAADHLTGDLHPFPLWGTGIEPAAERLVWGTHVGSEPVGIMRPVRHKLSAAARTFLVGGCPSG